MATLTKFYEGKDQIPLNKRPDLIHVAGKYLLIKIREGAITRDGTELEAGTYHCQPQKADEYGVLHAITNIQEIATASNQVIYKYGEILNKLSFA